MKNRFQSGRIYVFRLVSTMQTRSSTTREMVVARAAPLECSAGSPNSPKMNTAFRPILISTAILLITALGLTWSVTFIMVR